MNREQLRKAAEKVVERLLSEDYVVMGDPKTLDGYAAQWFAYLDSQVRDSVDGTQESLELVVKNSALYVHTPYGVTVITANEVSNGGALQKFLADIGLKVESKMKKTPVNAASLLESLRS